MLKMDLKIWEILIDVSTLLFHCEEVKLGFYSNLRLLFFSSDVVRC